MDRSSIIEIAEGNSAFEYDVCRTSHQLNPGLKWLLPERRQRAKACTRSSISPRDIIMKSGTQIAMGEEKMSRNRMV